jgi:hypothetical protein
MQNIKKSQNQLLQRKIFPSVRFVEQNIDQIQLYVIIAQKKLEIAKSLVVL